MKYDFTYNDLTIPYEIVRKKVKNINIRIKPNSEMVVSCNDTINNKEIEFLMLKRIRWITKTIKEFKEKTIVFSNLNNKLVDGEEFLLLGRVLRVKNVFHRNFSVNYDNNYLYIYSPNRKIKIKFKEWYELYTKKKIDELLNKVHGKFVKYKVSKPNVLIKKMRTRWGTCNINKKFITLNKELIKVDEFLIEYVLTHEMIHFIYKNHTKKFWDFLTMMMPDWKEREKILNSIFIK